MVGGVSGFVLDTGGEGEGVHCNCPSPGTHRQEPHLLLCPQECHHAQSTYCLPACVCMFLTTNDFPLLEKTDNVLLRIYQLFTCMEEFFYLLLSRKRHLINRQTGHTTLTGHQNSTHGCVRMRGHMRRWRERCHRSWGTAGRHSPTSSSR